MDTFDLLAVTQFSGGFHGLYGAQSTLQFG